MTESHKAGCRRKGCIIPAASITLIVAMLVGREVYIAATAMPGSTVNYRAKATELVDSYQPKGGENGWGALLDAVDVYNAAAAQDSSGIGWSDAFKLALDPLSYDPARTLYPLERYLSTAESATSSLKEQGIHDHLDRLADASTYTRQLPLGGRLATVLLPELLPAIAIGRSLALELRRASELHDDAATARAVVRSLALGKAISQQHSLMDRLVAIAMFGILSRELRFALTERPPAQQELDRIADALDRYRLPALKLAIEGEHINILDTIQWAHTDDGYGNGRLIVSRLNMSELLGGPSTNSGLSSAIANLSSIRYPRKRQTIRQANTLFESLFEYSELTRQERLSQTSSPYDSIDALPRRQVVLRMLVPAFGKAIAANDVHNAHYAGTRTMVAIEQFNAHRGHYPSSLDELVPDLLTVLPIDPFAPDGRFIYRTFDPATDPFGRSYTLYSVGYDGNDDGGQVIDDDQPQNALERDHPGTDFVFNLPRPDAGD